MSSASHRETQLAVVLYHYVRDLPRTRFPRLKGMLTTAFREQLRVLTDRLEPATLESATEFLRGRYRPKRDLCLLTFDDGLKEHYTDVLPLLRERGIQGTFFVTTACLNGRVAAVHKSHFLMAHLGFEGYRDAFMDYLSRSIPAAAPEIDLAEAQRTYRWDAPDVAAFKYLLNFKLDAVVREQALSALFEAQMGPEQDFAAELYLSWSETRELQAEGMVIGGHSHWHPALSNLETKQQRADLTTCARQLRRGLRPQASWPFSYPYGAFSQATVEILRELEFDCSFALEVGLNAVGHDRFRLRRFDTNDVPALLEASCQ